MLRVLMLEKDHAERLQALPSEFREAFEKRRKEASREPGSGKWVFPQPVLNETHFRASIGSASDSDS